MKRCRWCNLKNPLYITYHDSEWGKINLQDSYLFEMLLLESFQAGLSWECVLNKREAFRKAYDDFSIKKVASYEEEKIEELLQNQELIRNRLKVKASIQNAKIFQEIQKEYGSFSNYLMEFTHGIILYENDRDTNFLSDSLSKDLYKRGMRFVGSTILYSYLQAIGLIQSHLDDCDWYQKHSLQLIVPAIDDYHYEETIYQDRDTMHYNAGYEVSYDGYHYDTGCIDFPKEVWKDQYEKRKKEVFFYIQDGSQYVGTASYLWDLKEKRYECSIIIDSEHRGCGYAKEALYQLCYEAKKRGVDSLYDTFEKEREDALRVFLDLGFEVVEETTWKKFHQEVDGVVVRRAL